METIEILRSVGLVVAFLATAFVGRETWIKADMIACSAFGVGWLVFPRLLLGIQTVGELDAVHVNLTQMFGLMLIGPALVVWRTRGTRDQTVDAAYMMSRVLSGITLLICMVQVQVESQGKTSAAFNEHHIYFGILGLTLLTLGNLINLIRTNDFGGTFQGATRLDWHLRLDFLLSMTFCIIHLVGTKLIEFELKTDKTLPKGFDLIHLHMLHAGDCMLIGSAFLSYSALSFRYDNDKRVVLFGRFLVTIVALAVFYWNCFVAENFPRPKPAQYAIQSFYILNAFFGAFFPYVRFKRE